MHSNYILAVASRHIYVIEKDDGTRVEATINLKSIAQYCFIFNNKLYVGGPIIEIFNLNKWPFPKISTIKLQLNPLPSKIQVIDDFHFFSGEALFSMSKFE